MLGAITFNINRGESVEPINYKAFLRYPSVETADIDDMSEIAIAITSSIIPPMRLLPIWESEREKLISSYYWISDLWMYE
jgi:hypothetical protein